MKEKLMEVRMALIPEMTRIREKQLEQGKERTYNWTRAEIEQSIEAFDLIEGMIKKYL